MNTRTIDLDNFTDTAALKMFILQKLLLVDHKKDSVAEFDDRLKGYIDGNAKLQMVFRVNRERLEKDLRFRLSLAQSAQPYPENFEMGNPLNRWIGQEGVARTDEEKERDQAKLEETVQANLLVLQGFLNELRLLGRGRILVEDR